MAGGKLVQVYSSKTKRMRNTKKKAKAKTVKAIVKNELAKTIETFKNQHYLEEQSISTLGGYFYSGDAMSLTQSDAYSGLSGHWVKAVGHSIKMFFNNNSTQTLFVRILVLKNKVLGTDFTTGVNLFENNTNNISAGAINSSAQLMARVNKDRYRVLRERVIRLGSSSSIDGGQAKYISMYIKDSRKYNYDGSALLPRQNIFVIAFPCQSATDVLVGENVEITSNVTFYYKDI